MSSGCVHRAFTRTLAYLRVRSSPEHYDLTIRTDLCDLTFSGAVEITFRTTNSIPYLTLHTASPSVLTAAVLSPALGTKGSRTGRRPALRIVSDQKKQRARIFFEGGDIAAGRYRVGLRWRGEIQRTILVSSSKCYECAAEVSTLLASLVGYFSSSYAKKGQGDHKAFYAITHFKPCVRRCSLYRDSVGVSS